MRPATNEEETQVTEAIAPLLSGLTEAIREGCTRHFADITDEGEPKDNEATVVEGDVSSTYLQIPTPPQAAPDQKPMRGPSLRYQRQPVLTWKPGSAIVEFDSEKRAPILRGTTWTFRRTKNRWWNRLGKTTKRAETRECGRGGEA